MKRHVSRWPDWAGKSEHSGLRKADLEGEASAGVGSLTANSPSSEIKLFRSDPRGSHTHSGLC